MRAAETRAPAGPPVAAGSIAAFGLVNAVLILIATAFSATALDADATSTGDVLLLYDCQARR